MNILMVLAALAVDTDEPDADADRVARFRDGDANAFGELYRAHVDAVYRRLSRILGPVAEPSNSTDTGDTGGSLRGTTARSSSARSTTASATKRAASGPVRPPSSMSRVVSPIATVTRSPAPTTCTGTATRRTRNADARSAAENGASSTWTCTSAPARPQRHATTTIGRLRRLTPRI